jgi:hypothetical protein
VGVAAGALLFFTAPKASATSASRTIRPYAGLGTVGAYGRF